jgi:hypothetical protein
MRASSRSPIAALRIVTRAKYPISATRHRRCGARTFFRSISRPKPRRPPFATASRAGRSTVSYGVAAAAPAFIALAPHLPQNQWLVCAMEAHVCVYQTARDLAARGAEVQVVADAVCSRAKPNWKLGLELAAAAGATVTSTEVAVFDLLRRAGTDEFKTLSQLIK